MLLCPLVVGQFVAPFLEDGCAEARLRSAMSFTLASPVMCVPLGIFCSPLQVTALTSGTVAFSFPMGGGDPALRSSGDS
ncbi:hypothetical protein D7294_05645 [Streptomyces hoynatensis]|uniref:Uncharacterized protein n=1 Tax=Streptomyces hoynatensis TaxID=1141874 RepID=A0A3A9ZC63_9ACTN|nr:hypothetical protein D7294_05645 [Streptomyces hoynatensis]